MKISVALLFSCVIASNSAFAHRDRILPIAQDGTLADIPAEFGPANLKIDFSAPMNESNTITSMALKLGERRIELPVCVTGFLRSQSIDEVRAVGSWYHDESLIPYYLSLTFFDPGYSVKKWANPGVILLLNLRTGKIIKMQFQIVQDEGRTIQFLAVDLKSRCTPAVLAAITDPSAR